MWTLFTWAALGSWGDLQDEDALELLPDLPCPDFWGSVMSEKAPACPGAREQNQDSKWESAPKGFV